MTKYAQPPAGTPTLTVNDAGHILNDLFMGAAKYADGSILVIVYRTPPHAPNLSGPLALRMTPSHGNWQRVWAAPEAWLNFIINQPVGTNGKASNRRMETISINDAVPTRHITIWAGGDTWVRY